MGYTHYWYRPKNIKPDVFSKIVEDFRKVLPIIKGYGVVLKGPLGEGEPIINENEVSFNGDRNCGHTTEDMGILWPSENAGGVNIDLENKISGEWYAGKLIETRTCDGDCSHESFYFPRDYKPLEWEKPKKNGLYFQFCKTAFKPYDLAVNVFLVIAKYHLQDKIRVCSDGKDTHWFDGKLICQMELGYGMEMTIDEQKGELLIMKGSIK
ncbi:MAG: hypothetical protein ACPLRZ_11470 [Thermovenabulum sp.]|uniref:hypothetical protein n=1 Tax=Thermovenabulum sp. TaxID=3100335 RepID=UPI003C7DED40